MFGKGLSLVRRLYLELKSLSGFFFVPSVVVLILTPLSVLAATESGGGLAECGLTAQLLVPGFAAWWPLLAIREHFGAGRELLFVYKHGIKDSLLFRMVLLWCFFAVQAAVLFAYLHLLLGSVLLMFLAIAIQSLFLIALAYFLALMLQNTFVPLIINFSYVSVFMLAFFYSPLSIFTVGSFASRHSLSKSVVVAILASLLFCFGYQIEKRLYKDSI